VLIYFLAFVILLIARRAVLRIAAFAVYHAISAVFGIATRATVGVPAVFTADCGATFPITKIHLWGFVTFIAPKALAFVAPDETDFVLLVCAWFAHTHEATLASIGADADENTRDFIFLGAPFTKHQVARLAIHERNVPVEACWATTQKVLVAKVALRLVEHALFTGHAVREFATLALTSLAYDTKAARARAEIEGSLQRLFNVRLVPNVLPETVQIVLVQPYEVASSEHEAIETLLLGAHVDMCDLGQKIEYFVIYGQ
jgi:hypothetical protein